MVGIFAIAVTFLAGKAQIVKPQRSEVVSNCVYIEAVESLESHVLRRKYRLCWLASQTVDQLR